MKTPSFWKNDNLISAVLSPIGMIYGAATALRFKLKKPYQAHVPVICIGNITAGGVGKTPVSMALAEMMQKQGKNPFFISRGYGGKLSGVLVDTQKHTAYDVGDEPMMLARIAPTIVCHDRAKAAQIAVENGADILIMDDGFQNPSLKKDVSFLVFNEETGIGNGRIIPSGPLRESLKSGFKRADAIIFIGENIAKILKKTDKPVFMVRIKEENPKHQGDVVAFAGIGYPLKFYHSLEKCGLKPLYTYDFGDHHFYEKDELKSILKKAHKKNLPVYTTSKDFVKIPADFQKRINVLHIKAIFEDASALMSFIQKHIKR